MVKKEYKFNPQTLSYEVIVTPFKMRFYRLLRKLLIGFILASLVNFAFSYFFYTPKMYQIAQENNELMLKYDVLQSKIRGASKKLMEIKHRDQSVYRPLFAADTLSMPEVYELYPDQKYAAFRGDRFEPIMMNAWLELDALARQLYMESKSFDELQLLTKDKEQMSTAIPAIWPVNKKHLKGSIGAFGGRNHPILGRFMAHSGIDFGCDKGRPVYATGNARVVLDGNSGRGYGKQILLDHGFGYKTRYAHLNKILVTPGQLVKRGEVIGEVGSTGRSTGPHLHYEVIYRGKHVDPINYFRRDMNEEEFQKILESAKETTYESAE